MSELAEPQVRRGAGIDIGTNSVKLIVADMRNPSLPAIFDTSTVTRIGEGMEAQAGRLREVPMRRTLDALAHFVETAHALGVEAIAAVGTAALRDAQNRDEFLERVRARCGLNVDVISGDEEARLSYLAVRRDPHWRLEPRLLVIDVGGGSTEVIRGEPGGDGIAARVSARLGAVRLTEGWLRADPPTVAQLAEASRAAADVFGKAGVPHSDGSRSHPAPRVVGVGGTVSTLGAMAMQSRVGLEPLHGFRLTADELEQRIKQLAGLTIAQRTDIPGLDSRRADIILGGAIMLSQALAHIGSTAVDVSTRGLRWGLLYDRFLS